MFDDKDGVGEKRKKSYFKEVGGHKVIGGIVWPLSQVWVGSPGGSRKGDILGEGPSVLLTSGGRKGSPKKEKWWGKSPSLMEEIRLDGKKELAKWRGPSFNC